MISMIGILIIFAAFIILMILAIIDLKTRLLPDIYNASLVLLGVGFHGLTQFSVITPIQMVLGAFIGGGFLYTIRFVGNKIYDQDTLGLGDVKLMAAAGLWLGFEHILLAITIGGIAGLVHGFGVYMYEKSKTDAVSLMQTSIPAGPGFIVGILTAGFFVYKDFVVQVLMPM